MNEGRPSADSGSDLTQPDSPDVHGWQPIETAPKNEMFIWAYRRDGRWSVGLAYRNVSGGWSDAYGDQGPPQHATHWIPLPPPPVTMRKIRNEIIDECAKAVPTNWCDALLTGPGTGGKLPGRETEALLRGIQDRIRGLKR